MIYQSTGLRFDQMRQVRIAVMGSGGVGKSALVIRFVQNMFIQIYDPTFEDLYTKNINVDNQDIELQILDTSGVSTFVAMRDLYYKNADGFLLVYAINSQSSFDEIQNIHAQIRTITSTKPIQIIGNKIDLHERYISQSQGLNLSRTLGTGWSETSAKNIINVEESFSYLVSEILKTSSINLLLFKPLHAQLTAQKPKKQSKKLQCKIM